MRSETPYGFISVSTPAAGNVVTLAEAAEHLRLIALDGVSPTSYGDDDRITAAIQSAESYIEDVCWYTLLDTEFEWRISQLPRVAQPLTLPKNPVSTVTSISYTKSDGTTDTVTPRVIKSKGHTILLPPEDETWPASRGDEGDVVITFNAGFADADSVPKGLKQAVLLAIGTFYEHRESEVIGTITSGLKAAESLAWAERNIYR